MAEINGQGYSRLVGGPSGVWLMYQKTFSGPLFDPAHRQRPAVGRGEPITPTATSATPTTTSPRTPRAASPSASSPPSETPPGLFVTQLGRRPSLVRAAGHRAQPPRRPVTSRSAPRQTAAASPPSRARARRVRAARRSTWRPSAPSRPPHVKGLGNLNGDGIGGLGGDPLASVSCTDVHFGDIDAIAEAGCFLRDPSNPDQRRGDHLWRDPPQRPGDHPRRRRPDRHRPAPAHDQHHRRRCASSCALPGSATSPSTTRHSTSA